MSLRLYDKEQIERLKEENAKQLTAQMEKLKADNTAQLAALKLDAQTRERVQQKALAERLEKRRKEKGSLDTPGEESKKRTVPSVIPATSGSTNYLSHATPKLPSNPSSSATVTSTLAPSKLTPWNDVDF